MGDGQVQQPAVIHRRLHDPSIMFEEYRYYATIQREQERQGLGPGERTARQLAGLANPAEKASSDGIAEDSAGDEKTRIPANKIQPGGFDTSNIAPAEWENASRAARNATWGAV